MFRDFSQNHCLAWPETGSVWRRNKSIFLEREEIPDSNLVILVLVFSMFLKKKSTRMASNTVWSQSRVLHTSQWHWLWLCVTQQQRSFCMSTTSVAFAALLLMLFFWNICVATRHSLELEKLIALEQFDECMPCNCTPEAQWNFSLKTRKGKCWLPRQFWPTRTRLHTKRQSLNCKTHRAGAVWRVRAKQLHTEGSVKLFFKN